MLDGQIIFKTVKILFKNESTDGFGAEDAAAMAGGEEKSKPSVTVKREDRSEK